MELNRTEVEVVEEVPVKAADALLRELTDLQMVLVGGGIGDTII